MKHETEARAVAVALGQLDYARRHCEQLASLIRKWNHRPEYEPACNEWRTAQPAAEVAMLRAEQIVMAAINALIESAKEK